MNQSHSTLVTRHSSLPVLPGATLGVLGSGQLGRMFAVAARRMGYRVHTFSPERDTPTGQVADAETTAPYEDLDAVREFARSVDAVTFEFENVPAPAVEAVGRDAPVRPSGEVLHTTQHRLREKSFLSKHSFPVTPFRRVASVEDLRAGLDELNYPAVLKTADFGYDGKGQRTIKCADEADEAFAALGGREGILEAFVAFERELSVVAARGSDGAVASYGVVENSHARHILDHTVAPAGVSPAVARRAEEIARALLEQLDYVGVLCVELFLTGDDGLFVNELAPRPHNSGHFTIEACAASQFEQQVRALCNLPLGSTEQFRPAAMANLLGDLWQNGEPDWRSALAVPNVALHLYGKRAARTGRKMGHLTALAHTTDEALRTVLAARASLDRRA
ncbi:MAG: 5-(carboxyamino)imidazole ribonucleotide synthase [Acidobacteria bacterium]|nr:5-(carboxyamino)imidazole ribonucleotide synthase [Acidobacteriota bacterium]MCA1632407.1 5-(carboxyamino)imidazole ribonucleotide synthase [Acidobacteriota bacterium]MCA1640749.1 5-(carboxyamino)imidazole ribonucleotide synthase [Acidobacteriota bacterium]